LLNVRYNVRGENVVKDPAPLRGNDVTVFPEANPVAGMPGIFYNGFLD
jgi:hypothetical protein